MSEYQIDYTILRDGVEIGFGGANAPTLDAVAYDIGTALQRREWETAPGQPDPSEVDR